MIVNAKIRNTFLGVEDHGILTFMLYVDMDGCSCGVGGYALDRYDREQDKRVYSAKGMETVAKVLEVVGVDSWEKLPGKYIRVVDNGRGSTIDKIGNIIKDEWFDMREFFSQK